MRRKQSTRMLKCQCPLCAYSCRTTRVWLLRAGPPLCPDRDCSAYGEPMEPPAAWAEELEAAFAAEATSYRILREKALTLQSRQRCARCRSDLEIGEWAHHRVYTADGEFVSAYECFACSGASAGRRSVALARA